jgi:predicted nucleic acid-binding protein
MRAGQHASVRRLDSLGEDLEYLPLDTSVMRRAAVLWAHARNTGVPTAPPEALDADVILAAQAEAAGAIVATENVGHIARFVTARHWREIG